MIKILIINLFFLFNNPTGDYCDGFEGGYKDGYCYNDNRCITPIAPLCPLRSVYEDDTYKAGYQRGFKLGLCKKNH